MDTEELGEQRDDSQIEISDLTLRLARQDPHVPWHQRRVELPRPLVAASVVALVALALLAVLPVGSELAVLFARATPPAIVTRLVVATPVPASPTPSPYPTPTLIAPAVGLTPRDCPPGPPLISFDPAAVGPGVGGRDVWLTAPFIEPRSTVFISLESPSSYTPYGWPVPLQIYIRPGLSGLITLTGSDLRTRYALWLSGDDPNPQPAVPVVTIDPTQIPSQTIDGLWKIWFGALYLPGAGCYALQASWPGGGWRITFAAGR